MLQISKKKGREKKSVEMKKKKRKGTVFHIFVIKRLRQNLVSQKCSAHDLIFFGLLTGRLSILTFISGPPVEVGVTMYVLSISSLSEVKMVLFRSYAVYAQKSTSRVLRLSLFFPMTAHPFTFPQLKLFLKS